MTEPEAMNRYEPVLATVATSGQSNALRGPSIIGRLEFRDLQLVVHASGRNPAGPRFSVLGPRGNVLANTLADDELRARFPDLHRAYGSAFARGGSFLDARIEK